MGLFDDGSEKTLESRLAFRSQSSPAQSIPAAPPTADRILPPPSQATLTPSGNRAYLDQGCEINGKLKFEGPVRIDGTIEGEIDGQETVTIGKTAVVNARIKAQSIVVAGLVKGDLTASQRIELQPSAKVSGSLTAPKLVVLEGAVFDGTCTMHPKAVRDDRKLAAPHKDERIAADTNGQQRAGQI